MTAPRKVAIEGGECERLTGHTGDHRLTLTRRAGRLVKPTAAPKAPAAPKAQPVSRLVCKACTRSAVLFNAPMAQAVQVAA